MYEKVLCIKYQMKWKSKQQWSLPHTSETDTYQKEQKQPVLVKMGGKEPSLDAGGIANWMVNLFGKTGHISKELGIESSHMTNQFHFLASTPGAPKERHLYFFLL